MGGERMYFVGGRMPAPGVSRPGQDNKKPAGVTAGNAFTVLGFSFLFVIITVVHMVLDAQASIGSGTD